MLLSAACLALAFIVAFSSWVSAAPAITATDRDNLQVDKNGDTKVNRGDVIRHTITITNTGDTDADATQFINTLDPDTTLVPGSVKTTPLAINDSYQVNEDTQLTVAAPGVLSNDRDPDGDSLSALQVSAPSHGTLSFSPDGSFLYTPDASYVGSDGFTYKNNDGTSDSNVAAVSITVLHVNRAPTNISLDNSSVEENKAAGTVVGTFTTTDPDAGDTHTYSLVSGTGSDDNGSFSISGDQLVTAAIFDYETKNYYSIRVRTTDNGSPNLSFEKVFVISVLNVNENPSATNKSYSALGNLRISVPADGLKTGASDPDSGDTYATLTVTPFNGKSAQQGDVVINANGSFTYDPPAGYTGSDSFTYKVCDTGGLCSPDATVTVTVSGMIWFINNNPGACASDCDGRLTHPFAALADFQAVNDGSGSHPKPNQPIFIYESAWDYSGPVTLLSGQRLIGQDATSTLATLAAVAPPANSDPLPAMNSGNGTHARIANSSGSAVILGASNYLYGFTLGNTTAAALSGASFGTLTVADVAIDTTGPAVSLSTGSLSGSFLSVVSMGGTNNISLTGIGGSFNFGSGSLSGAGGSAFYVSGGAATISYSGSISNVAYRHVDISGKTSGTVTFSGPLSGSGRGVYLNNNSGVTFAFTGGVNLATGADAAFTATGSGVVSVTGAGNTLLTTTGTALNVANTMIGAAGLNFRSISAGTAASGPASGIILSSTGSTGALTVTGSGSQSSGGTIQKTTQAAVSLSGTTAASLNYMNILQNGDRGISAVNVSGTLGVTGCSFQGTTNDAVRLSNDSAGFPYTATFTGCTFDTTSLGHGILFQTSTNQELNLTVTGASFSHASPSGATCRFLNLDQSAILVSAASPSSSNVTVENCYFYSNAAGDSVKVNPGGGSSTVVVQNNLIDGIGDGDSHAGDGIDIEADGDGALSAKVLGNTVRNIALTTAQGRGIRVKRDETSYTKVLVDGNTLSNIFAEGILVEARKNASASAPAADANVVITNNSLTNTNLRGGSPTGGAGISIHAWEGEADSSGKVRSCVAVSGNSVSGSGYADYLLRQDDSAVFRLEGYAGSSTDTAAIGSYLTSLDTGSPLVIIQTGTLGIVNGTCERPAP